MDRVHVRKGRFVLAALCVIVAAMAVMGSVTIAAATPPPIIVKPPFLPPWLTLGTASLPATVTGTVVDGSSNPIAGALVSIHGDTSSTAMTYFSQTATTNASGEFVIPDIIQGTYQLRVNDRDSGKALAAFSEAWPWHPDNGVLPDTRTYLEGGTTTDAGTITLRSNGHVFGRAMNGATGVSGSAVTAKIIDGTYEYTQWATTNSTGDFRFDDAQPGDWTVELTGSGASVPSPAVPANSPDGQNVTKSSPITLTLAEGGNQNIGTVPFVTGQQLVWFSNETTHSNAFMLPNIGITLTEVGGTGNVYYLITGDDGWLRAYMPPGTFNVLAADANLSDPLIPVYEDQTAGPITFVSGASYDWRSFEMVPTSTSYGVWGLLRDSVNASQNVECWVTAELIDPTSVWNSAFRRVPSLGSGPGGGQYFIRLPKNTGFPGNKVRLSFVEQATQPETPAHIGVVRDITSPVSQTYTPTLVKGGSISGTVRDEVGAVVPGVHVTALRKMVTAYGPAYSAADNWYTETDSSGNYTIKGLPADVDYKVTYSMYYAPGEPLPEEYDGYYRRVYKGKPVVDSLVESVTPVTGAAVEHTPVSVSPLGFARTGIDETITPGGYVTLSARGPEYPTGAVWCDVMYNVDGHWIEIDSGYTTGGTFAKGWKVMPTGTYRLDYADFFGRGAGSWSFDLAAGETKHTTVLVPAPATADFSYFSGTFAGVLAGPDQLLTAGALPATGTPSPILLALRPGDVYGVSLSGDGAAGTWTLTLPYDPAIPDGEVGSIRVLHYRPPLRTETLVPTAWNTRDHTIQVQTDSFSSFEVVAEKLKVSLGAPLASGTPRGYRYFTAYGSLGSKHSVNAHVAVVKVYKYNTRTHRWSYYKGFQGHAYNYGSGSRYRASVKLPRGTYRFYAYAPADFWHLATLSSYRTIRVR
ncbi:MAG: carboxypeptidase-like regulatory domain-containing protein [Coriobacteriia bacterium]|nr:carboxypeptidase-like regulatory domain-containing protein [Coriobacteriia bacterium]